MRDSKPTQQAFGSPGGKTYLAPRIAGMLPPHKVYVEPFFGGGAVYFQHPPSEKEVISDKDREIAFAMKFLRDMTPDQYERLKRYDWTIDRDIFNHLQAHTPKDDVERFRRFYYTKKGSFARKGEHVDVGRIGKRISLDRLPQVHKRIKRASIHGWDALRVIDKYDSPQTFFYLDPPYPGRASTGKGADEFTEEDLQRLISKLKHIRGKFLLSLGAEHQKVMPKLWHTKRVAVVRNIGGANWQDARQGRIQYEILTSNYNPETIIRRPSYRKPLPTYHRKPRRKPTRITTRRYRPRRTRKHRSIPAASSPFDRTYLGRKLRPSNLGIKL